LRLPSKFSLISMVGIYDGIYRGSSRRKIPWKLPRVSIARAEQGLSTAKIALPLTSYIVS
jgi:hypothetical protein